MRQLESEGARLWLARKLHIVWQQSLVKPCRQWGRLGALNFLRFAAWRAIVALRLPTPGGREFSLRAKRCDSRLLARRDSSDVLVFSQVFAEEHYDCIPEDISPGLIVDCGANVGYSSAYFLSRFPNAFLVAVEPDPVNCDLLERNLEPYANRTQVLRTGIWSESAGLVMSRDTMSSGMEWARTVRLAEDNEEADVLAIGISDILEQTPFDRIAVLKIDIEGAELPLFSRNVDSWLPLTDLILVELHSQACEDAFYNAIAGYPHELVRRGEIVSCRLLTASDGASRPDAQHTHHTERVGLGDD
ncbi:MAG: FkbM family methyltransferase [Planctomycetales bacterium]|nr:FkbM family methyltransferase [Planctomycetales bacterium]